MTSIRIEILNPKAARLIKNLADLNIIAIQSTSENGFEKILKKLRTNAKSAPVFDEITEEVELVRTKRYKK